MRFYVCKKCCKALLPYDEADPTCLCGGRLTLVEEVTPCASESLIHDWFELTHAEYLTVPRSILQAMPEGWQATMTALLDALDATFDWRPPSGRYWVELRGGDGRVQHDALREYRHPDVTAIERLRKQRPPEIPGA